MSNSPTTRKDARLTTMTNKANKADLLKFLNTPLDQADLSILNKEFDEDLHPRDDNGRFGSGGSGSGGGSGSSNTSEVSPDADQAQVSSEINDIQGTADSVQSDLEDLETSEAEEAMQHVSDAMRQLDYADNASSLTQAQDHLERAVTSFNSAYESARSGGHDSVANDIRDMRDSTSALADYIAYGEYDN